MIPFFTMKRERKETDESQVTKRTGQSPISHRNTPILQSDYKHEEFIISRI